MKKIKRVVALVLAAVMMMAMLAACGGGNGGASGSGASGGGKSDKLQIGIMHFTWTSREAQAILDYCNNYLGPAYNMEFTTFTCGFDNNSVIEAVENMITAGMDGLILLVSSGIIEVDKICAEAGVPFALITGKPTMAEEEILATTASDEFVCCVQPGSDPYEGGRGMARAMLERGYTRCAVISTPTGMIEAGDQEDEGFMTEFVAGGGTIVDEKREIPGDAMITAADTVLATHGDEIDFLYGLLDILQSIVTDPEYADKNVKIVSNELPSDGGVALFESGILAFAHDKIPQAVGFAVVGILNYLDGNQYADAPQYRSVEAKYTDINNAEDCQLYLDISGGTDEYPPAWTIEELDTLILSKNPNATYADLCALAGSTQIDQICERHGIAR